MRAQSSEFATPLVTVGMAVFNGEKYLAEAIESVLAQTLEDFQLLIVDDASTDKSGEIIRRYANVDSRVRVVTKSQNFGLVNARNTILSSATGTYLAWNDQDDLSLPSRLEIQSRFLKSHPSVAICGSWTWAGPSLNHRKVLRVPQSWSDIAAFIPLYNPICWNTTMFRIKSFNKGDLHFSTDAGLALDYDLWARAITNYEIRNLPCVTSLYRIHPEQNSQNLGRRQIGRAAVEIQLRYLKQVSGISLDSKEEQIHAALAQVPLDLSSFDSLDDLKGYLERLLQIEFQSQTISNETWRKVIGFTWFRILQAAVTSTNFRQWAAAQAVFSSLSRLIPEVIFERVMWRFPTKPSGGWL